MAIRVLPVDDHALFRKGLVALISQDAQFEVIGEADSGEEAIRLVHDLRPDIVLMDIEMPGISGIEATREIHDTHPGTRVVMLTATDLDDQVYDAVKNGASGYILKNLEPEQFFSTLRRVYDQGMAISSDMTNRIFQELNRRSRIESAKRQGTCSQLSDREMEVVRYLALGYTNREIANALGISLNTTKSHIANIMGKLQLKNRVEVAIYAVQQDGQLDNVS